MLYSFRSKCNSYSILTASRSTSSSTKLGWGDRPINTMLCVDSSEILLLLGVHVIMVSSLLFLLLLLLVGWGSCCFCL